MGTLHPKAKCYPILDAIALLHFCETLFRVFEANEELFYLLNDGSQAGIMRKGSDGKGSRSSRVSPRRNKGKDGDV